MLKILLLPMMKSTPLSIILILAFIHPWLGAQDNPRKPNPAEQKVLDNYVTRINAWLDRFTITFRRMPGKLL